MKASFDFTSNHFLQQYEVAKTSVDDAETATLISTTTPFVRLCNSGVHNLLGSLPTTFRVEVRDKNPRKKGWQACVYNPEDTRCFKVGSHEAILGGMTVRLAKQLFPSGRFFMRISPV